MYDKDKLTNIRNNMINGNHEDVREGIKEYGLTQFPLDYSSYLTELFYNDPADAVEVLSQLTMMLLQLQFIELS